MDYFAQQWQERDEVAELLLALINQSYGTADKIESWELDDDVFTGVFSDRITRTTTARFEFLAAPEGLTYTPLNPEVSERFGIETFAPKGKGKRKCNPARSFKCGNSCQAWKTKAGRPRQCRVKMTDAERKAYEEGMQRALGAAGASESAQEGKVKALRRGDVIDGDEKIFSDDELAQLTREVDARTEPSMRKFIDENDENELLERGILLTIGTEDIDAQRFVEDATTVDLSIDSDVIRLENDVQAQAYYNVSSNIPGLPVTSQEVFDVIREHSNGIAFEVEWGWSFIGDPPRFGREEITNKDKVRIPRAAKKVWEETILPIIPEGTIVTNTPVGGEGGARDRAYRRMGFGNVGLDGTQHGIKIDGKLRPIMVREENFEAIAAREGVFDD